MNKKVFKSKFKATATKLTLAAAALLMCFALLPIFSGGGGGGDSLASRIFNTASVNANPVTLFTRTDNLPASATLNRYPVTLTNPGRVWLTFAHEYFDNGNAYWHVSLQLENGTPLLSLTSSGREITKDTINNYLGAGTYYVVVRTNSSLYHTARDYTITVNFERNTGQFETEPNNTRENASGMTINTPIIGNLTEQNDVDYFKITLTEPGRVWLNFQHEYFDNGNAYWNVSLQLDTGTPLLSLTSNGREANKNSINNYLAAGTYYVVVRTNSSLYHSTWDYVLTVNFERNTGQFEIEPNDTRENASAMRFNAPIIGNLTSSGDADWFKITLTSPSVAWINFKHEYFDNGNAHWNVSLQLENGTPLLSLTSNGRETSKDSTQTNLAAGTYYVVVRTNSSLYHSNMEYTMTLTDGTNIIPTPPPSGTDPNHVCKAGCDINGDGYVDIDDLLMLLDSRHFNKPAAYSVNISQTTSAPATTSTVAATPTQEPTSKPTAEPTVAPTQVPTEAPDPTPAPTAAPTAAPVLGFTTPKISSGSSHVVALHSDGTVWAWGYNFHGQVGDGTTTRRNTPVQVQGISNIIAVAAGSSYTVVLRDDGTVWAWGNNNSGQLGDGSTANSMVPVQVQGLSNIKAITAGDDYTLALGNDGMIWAWGKNNYGQLGDGTTTNRNTPVRVRNLNNITSISAGWEHNVALRSDGTLWTWGMVYSGEEFSGGYGLDTYTTPVQVQGLNNIKDIAAGSSYTVVLRDDGTVWAWGVNYSGQLGDGSRDGRSSPAQVHNINHVSAIAAGEIYSVALNDFGEVWIWGDDQVHDETWYDHLTPIKMQNLTDIVTSISAGSSLVVLYYDGTVWDSNYWQVNINLLTH